MNALKTTLILIGISSFSYSFSQTVEQDFSHLDKNKDGKIDKTEFENAPPPPPGAAPKKSSSEKVSPSSTQKDAEEMADEDRSVAPPPAPPSFDSLDKNHDGVLDMDEFKMSPLSTRKRPGSQKTSKE